MYDRTKEIREAINAGERALSSLHEAERQLNAAGNWGLLDLFGGGGFSGFMKHMKVNNATQDLEQAKRDLMSFSDELRDIQDIRGLDIEIGSFLTFADFFFDGFLTDVLVQSKINNAKKQVREAGRRVEEVLRRLRREL